MCKIECYFCGTKTDNVETAIAADWMPSFYDGEKEICEPVCEDCIKSHLHRDQDGEFVRNTIGTELIRLSPDTLQRIRTAFYGVSDNLATLANALEMADLERGGKGGPLIEQHLIVCQALHAFETLTIGAYV